MTNGTSKNYKVSVRQRTLSKRTKRQPINLEKIFTNPTSDRGLISKIYKELKKVDYRESNNPIKKWGIELKNEFSLEEYQMAEKHLKKYSTSLIKKLCPEP